MLLSILTFRFLHFFLKIENRICYLYYNKPTAIANVEQIIYKKTLYKNKKTFQTLFFSQ